MNETRNIVGQGAVSVTRAADSNLLIKLSGPWHLTRNVPSAAILRQELESAGALKTVSFDTSGLTHWDSGLIAFLAQTSATCRAHNIEQDRGGLPDGLRRLLELAEAVPEKKGTRSEAGKAPFFQRVGNLTIGYGLSVGDFMEFLGELTVAFGKLVRGKARFRRLDLVEVIQECGANAVGIVTLISFLVGVILAFMGAVQLSQFGASIYVADLVCIGMTREMGAIMTAIIMSGRTGAAFAAKLGTMKVTQEIDALTTMGISPMEFLVLPRVIALVLMMPLLCLYADFLGMIGGLFVGVGMLGLSAHSYMQETISTLTLTNLFGGLFKATFYGLLIAIAGCLRGFRCGNSSSAVGDAATQAVVMSIVMGVVACGLFAVVFNIIGI
ncbi:ABC transporter permease [Candidatus Binatus sp.]|uniref:ABC transporter permease n=1 Tax=Candidatus Binatus sp. TaxID=2811406 RepID=UPI003C856B7C